MKQFNNKTENEQYENNYLQNMNNRNSETKTIIAEIIRLKQENIRLKQENIRLKQEHDQLEEIAEHYEGILIEIKNTIDERKI